MPRKDESTLAGWTAKASESEDARYEWTKNAIKEALADSGSRFDGQDFDVYPKGSYPNYTNVVRDSDVDVAVELTGLTWHEFIHDAKELSMEDVGVARYTGSYDLLRFKNDVEEALVRRFGRAAVDRGNKAIHVRESSQGLKADVVVCQTLVSHTSRYGRMEGIYIRPDKGGEIHNYPKQHLDQGITKNDATSRRYKRTVRILKRLENEMVENDVIDVVPSFLIESLVWNIPDHIFNNSFSWTMRVAETLRLIYGGYKERDKWLEANGIKYLFHSTQQWNEQQADRFASAALKYLELE